MTGETEAGSVVERASAGARLLTARGAGMRVVSVGANLALIALVTPADLGLLAIVRGITGIAGNSSDLGFAWALLRRREAPTAEEYGALAGVQLVLVVGFLALVIAVPGLLRSVGAVPAQWQTWMVVVLATMVTVPIGTGARIRIEREMDFRRIAIADVSTVLLLNVSLLGFAVANRFALGVFVSTGVTMLYSNLLLWFWSPGPGPRFNFGQWRRLSREFAGFSLGHVGSMLNTAVTPIVVANLFGLSVAGLWSLAVRLGNVLQLAFEGFRRAAVPAAALLADSRPQLRRLVDATLLGSARITVPLVAAIFAGLPVLGWLLPRWAGAVPVAQWYVLGFGVTGVLGAAVIPVAVTLRGAGPVLVEQFTPVIAGWAGFGVLAVMHRPDIAFAALPMFGALLVALALVAPRGLRPAPTAALGRLALCLMAVVLVTMMQHWLGVPPLAVPLVAALVFAVCWFAPGRTTLVPARADGRPA